MKSSEHHSKVYAYWIMSDHVCGLSSLLCSSILHMFYHHISCSGCNITKYTQLYCCPCATMLSITHRSSTTFSTFSNDRPVIAIETSCPIFRFIAWFCPTNCLVFWAQQLNNQDKTSCQ